MDVMPSEYQNIDLSRYEKVFVRQVISNDDYGYLILKVNPAMIKNENLHVLIRKDGICFFKFFNGFKDADNFALTMKLYKESIYPRVNKIISDKLKNNKALINDSGILKFSVSMVCVFPEIERKKVESSVANDIKTFATSFCMFKDDLLKLRNNFDACIKHYLDYSITNVANEKMVITDLNINAILQRIAPEYTTIRVASIIDEETKTGANNELLIVTSEDEAVKAFRLDEEQINIVNKINKGEQLILACAGSGKSVLLIAKCFKAAAMNPDKKFLITCFNNNLYSLYTWFIDKAGLRANNVRCMTFHKLCKTLLENNGYSASHDSVEKWPEDTIIKFNKGHIKDRYYGIFIDEVQEFETEWYKLCYNLLENKNSDDHLFVICGDKTQKLKKQQKRGKAPWNAGEGYPNYRGGNKNIRIERNYRNCIEINEYINRYVTVAKQYLRTIGSESEMDPDMFLRGKSMFHGENVKIKALKDKSNKGEACSVYESIREIHDIKGIPYDEIAVVMFNAGYRKRFNGWNDPRYDLETPLSSLLEDEGIRVCKMYKNESDWGSRYGESGGVKFIKFDSVLGLDFRAVIVCGLLPLGEYHKIKNPDWENIKKVQEDYENKLQYAQDDIRHLYVACTRAKEILHVITPENDSIYIKLLKAADKKGE